MSSGRTQENGPSAEEPAPPEYATRDQLRAMAHPLRMEIVERVGRRGTARAADVAADLGVPANSVSYHLRILARGGVIEEAPEAARDRRDRVWRLTQRSFHLGRRGAGSLNDPDQDDADYLAATGAAAQTAFDVMRSAWTAELARHHALGPTSEEGLGVLYNTTVRVSREQMRELNRLVNSTILEYSRLNRDEHGADLPGDPDSEGETLTFRALWVAVGEPSGEAPAAQRPEGSSSSSSTARPSSRA